MAQIAIVGLNKNGEIKTAIGEHHSEASSWAVTVSGQVTSAFAQIAGPPATVSPGEVFTISNCAQNTGDMKGTVYIHVDELNVDGFEVSSICAIGGSVDVGYYCGVAKTSPEPDTSCGFGTNNTLKWWTVNLRAPTTPGTYYYGIKTWGESESEPNYPVPTLALAGGKVPVTYAADGETPSFDTIFACLLPRIGGDLTPRASCFTGSEDPLKLECFAPRLSCLMNIEQGVGSLSLSTKGLMGSSGKNIFGMPPNETTKYLNFSRI